MADVNKGTHFMRGVVKWASILTPNETFEPTYQATLLKPTQVNNFGEVINGDSATMWPKKVPAPAPLPVGERSLIT